MNSFARGKAWVAWLVSYRLLSESSRNVGVSALFRACAEGAAWEILFKTWNKVLFRYATCYMIFLPATRSELVSP